MSIYRTNLVESPVPNFSAHDSLYDNTGADEQGVEGIYGSSDLYQPVSNYNTIGTQANASIQESDVDALPHADREDSLLIFPCLHTFHAQCSSAQPSQCTHENCKELALRFGHKVLKLTFLPGFSSKALAPIPKKKPSLCNRVVYPLWGEGVCTGWKQYWGRRSISLIALVAIAGGAGYGSSASSSAGSSQPPLSGASCSDDLAKTAWHNVTVLAQHLLYLNQTKLAQHRQSQGQDLAVEPLAHICGNMTDALSKMENYLAAAGVAAICQSKLFVDLNPLKAFEFTTDTIGRVWDYLSGAETDSACLELPTQAPSPTSSSTPLFTSAPLTTFFTTLSQALNTTIAPSSATPTLNPLTTTLVTTFFSTLAEATTPLPTTQTTTPMPTTSLSTFLTTLAQAMTTLQSTTETTPSPTTIIATFLTSLATSLTTSDTQSLTTLLTTLAPTSAPTTTPLPTTVLTTLFTTLSEATTPLLTSTESPSHSTLTTQLITTLLTSIATTLATTPTPTPTTPEVTTLLTTLATLATTLATTTPTPTTLLTTLLTTVTTTTTTASTVPSTPATSTSKATTPCRFC